MDISGHVKIRQCSKDEMIFAAREKSDGLMYFVIDGQLGFFRTRNQIEFLINQAQKNDFFGEMALLAGTTRATTVRVLSDTARLGQIDEDAFHELCRYNSAFVWKLLQSIIERMGNAEGKISRLHAQLNDLDLNTEANRLPAKDIILQSIKVTEFVHSVPVRTALRGEKVIEEGQPGDGCMFFVISGDLAVLTGEIPDEEVRTIGKG
ncbi:MAG: cyclic nucleotide-binding domain-containing protein, partial [Leptospiraceae bacterium]|nr:cyclic nucleotide-binding domain-containing protein [Leptospiraceae bacterium]